MLVQQIRDFGPHVVSGYFGSPYYSSKAKVVGKIEDKLVFGWDEQDHVDVENLTIQHCVVLVGAQQIDDNRFVYFLDPAIKSDPKAPLTQKIHRMGYDVLCNLKYITTQLGVNDCEQMLPRRFIYAVRAATLAELRD